MMKRLILYIGMATLTSLLLAACGGPRAATLDIEMKEFEFAPATYSLPAGADLTINLSNTGTLKHEMVIFKKGVVMTPPVDEDSIEENVFWEAELEAGQAQAFTLTAPTEPGEYQVICAIPGHFEAGMAASLAITE